MISIKESYMPLTQDKTISTQDDKQRFSSYKSAQELDLNQYLIANPSAVRIFMAEDDAMDKAGIFIGDYVLVDTALEVTDGDLVVARYDDSFLIRQIDFHGKNGFELLSTNNNFSNVSADDCKRTVIIGPVTSVLRKY